MCFLPPHESPLSVLRRRVSGSLLHSLTTTAGWSMDYLDTRIRQSPSYHSWLPRRWPLGRVTRPHHSPVSPPSVFSCPPDPTIDQALGGLGQEVHLPLDGLLTYNTMRPSAAPHTVSSGPP